MRTENLAVMLTDMKGFTAATSRQTRAENARMLALQDLLLLPVVQAFGGLRVKTIGDAYLVLFSSPTGGLLCGMALQDRLWDYNRQAPEPERIEVRVVLSLGEVRLEGPAGHPTDVFGEAVNLASRVEGEAEAGEIWFTEAVRLVADEAEVPADDLGLRPLKGFPEPVRLYRVARTGSGVEEPPFGGRALSRVSGVARPDPARLARAVRRREGALHRGLSALRPRGALAVVAALALMGAGGWFWASALWKDPERLAAEGRFERASQAIEARAARLGPESPRILYLRGKLEAARADADAGGKLEEAFKLWSRALAKGNLEARAALLEEAGSPACRRRLLAARALVDAHTGLARGPLEALAKAEPPEERPSLFGAAGDRCGAGDVAREGLADLEGAGQLP